MAFYSRFSALALAFSMLVAPNAAFSQSTTSAERPLLLIRFNQEHVHFNRALRQAVANAENIKPGVVYRVVSVVPVNRKGAPSIPAAQTKRNLTSVTSSMAQLGVSSDRIKTSSENSKSASSQEIKLFVE
ncbi:MAG: hypothetical protein LW823_01720 [Rickettsiales bacterium]|jgi:hypothetical protein|nr:hypothetical protein [Rickettsiales bacterium]